MKSNLGLVFLISGVFTVGTSVAPEPPKPAPINPPPKCAASIEAVAAINAQQTTIDKLSEMLKKSVDSLAQSCGK